MNNKQKSLVRFLGTFFGIIILYYVLVMSAGDFLLSGYLSFSASIVSLVLGVFGQDALATANVVSSSQHAMIVSFGCDGTEPMAFYLAATMAVPIAFKNKWKPMLLFIFALFAINIARLITLFNMGVSDGSAFDTGHLIGFPILFIIIALVFWAITIKWAEKTTAKASSQA